MNTEQMKAVIKLCILLFRGLLLFCIVLPCYCLLTMCLLLTRGDKRGVKQSTTWCHTKRAVYDCFTATEKLVTICAELFSIATLRSAWNKICALPEHTVRKRGRKPIADETKQQVLEMKGDNRRWGARTIAYELQKKLGVPISRETVRKIEILYRESGDIPPEGLWKYFQVAVWQSLYACDFIYKRIKSKTYFVFFIIQLHTRKIVQCGVTEHPNTAFLRNQLSAFSDHYPDSYLIHDNSPELKYFPYKEYHIKGISIVPYSPNMRPFGPRAKGIVLYIAA